MCLECRFSRQMNIIRLSWRHSFMCVIEHHSLDSVEEIEENSWNEKHLMEKKDKPGECMYRNHVRHM